MGANKESAEASLAGRGNQDPDLREGALDTPGCVSLRSSRLQVISLGKKKMEHLELAFPRCPVAGGWL